MSLQVWLTLNGNSNNQGVAAPSFGGSPASWNSAGKLGTSPVFAGNSGHHFTSTFRGCDYVDNFSWTMWVKCTNNSGNTSWAFTNGRADYGEYGWGLQTGNNNVTIWFGTNTWAVSSTLDTWTHFGFTKSGTTIYIYKNGSLYTTATVSTSSYPTFGDGNGIGLGCFYYSGGCIYPFYGELCDFRIYDNCLSAGEIKDISRGLVVHYPMNNGYVEPTTNLVTGLTAGGQTTISGDTVITSGINADTYFDIKMSESLTEGVVYTISCFAENLPVGTGWTFPIGGQSNTALSFNIDKNGWNYYTFTMNNFSAGANHCFMDDTRRTAYTANCKFSKWQIEKKNHVTPYTPSSRSESIVYDVSGQKNNATVSANTLKVLANNSARYDKSTYFDGNASNWFSCQSMIKPTRNITFSCWCKQDSGTSPQSLQYIMSMGRDNTANGFNLISSSGVVYVQGAFGWISSGINIVGGWHMITGTYDGANIKIYVDGILKATSAYTSDLTYDQAQGGLVIGKMSYGYTGTSYYFMFNGSISDVRMYATTLSAEDVLDLYNAPIKIAKSGALITNGEVVE